MKKILMVLVFCSLSFGASTKVVKSGIATSAVATCKAGFASSVASGNLLVAAVSWAVSSSFNITIDSVKDKQGTKFTLLTSSYATRAGTVYAFVRSELAYATAASSTADSVTVYFSGSQLYSELAIYELTAGQLDQQVGSTGTTFVPVAGTITTATDSSTAIAIGIMDNGYGFASGWFTAITGWTLPLEHGQGNENSYSQYKIIHPAGALRDTITSGYPAISGPWASTMITFKPAGATTYDTCFSAAGTGGTRTPASVADSSTNANHNLKFTATPSAGYTFSSWTDKHSAITFLNSSNTTAACSLTISANDTVLANFAAITYDTIWCKAGAAGSVSPASRADSSSNANHNLSFTASAYTGYSFVTWKSKHSNVTFLNGSATTPVCSLTITSLAVKDTIYDSLLALPAIPIITYAPDTGYGVAVDSVWHTQTVTNTGGAVTSWSSSPALPTGLGFDASGNIVGTPTTTATKWTAYIISATNAGGTGKDTLYLAVFPQGSVYTAASITVDTLGLYTLYAYAGTGGTVRHASTIDSLSHTFYDTADASAYHVVTNVTLRSGGTVVTGVPNMSFRLLGPDTADVTYGYATPSAPTKIYPADGATAISKNVTFRWNSVAADSFYIIDVDTSVGFASALHTSDTLTDTIKAKTLTKDTTNYRWRVRGNNGSGALSGSTIISFKTAAASSGGGGNNGGFGFGFGFWNWWHRTFR